MLTSKDRLNLSYLFFFLCFGFRALHAQVPEAKYLDSLLLVKDSEVRTQLLFEFMFEKHQFIQKKSEAEPYLKYAQKMLDQATTPLQKAKAQQALSFIYSRALDFSRSLKFANQALTQFEQDKYWRGIAELKYLLAYLKMNNGDESRIIPECYEALNLCKEHNLIQSRILISSWLGGYYLDANQLDSAIHHLFSSMHLPGATANRKAFNHFDIGNCYMVKREIDSALAYYDKAKELSEGTNNKLINAVIISSNAYANLLKGNLDLAETLALESINLMKKYGPKHFVRDGYATLMDIYEAKGNLAKALENAKQYQAYTDSANNDANQNEYRELKEKYEADLKDQVIAQKEQELKAEAERRNLLIVSGLLFLMVAALLVGLYLINKRRKETELKERSTESEMKALRAQMNPHFMFNSLNAIQQMVLNQENENAFRYLDTYSKLTRQILENSEKKWITVAEEVRFLELYLKMESLRFDHSFTHHIEVDEEVMPNTDKVPAMVVQPLVENAIKHGLLPKQAGERNLTIRIFKPDEEGHLVIEVNDNGVGRKPKSSANAPDHHSMSLQITQNRLALISEHAQAGIEIKDLKDNEGKPTGTSAILTIPQPQTA